MSPGFLVGRSATLGSIQHGPAVAETRVLTAAGNLDGPTGLAVGERWYVAYTKPHRESAAQRQLAVQSFRSFLPRYRKTIRHARKLTTVNAAFFPRYLFVALDLQRDAWRSVNGTFGISSLVMDEAFPRAVPRGVVESLLEVSDDGGFLHFGEALKLGDRVRVMTGPFANLVGELVRLDGAHRVQVLLQLLGGGIRTSIDRNDLVPTRAM